MNSILKNDIVLGTKFSRIIMDVPMYIEIYANENFFNCFLQNFPVKLYFITFISIFARV